MHERGYLITPAPPAGFAFTRPGGTPVPASPHLPPTSRDITSCHDAAITSDTIIPNWNGDKLDLDHAIWVAFANARPERLRLGPPRLVVPVAQLCWPVHPRGCEEHCDGCGNCA